MHKCFPLPDNDIPDEFVSSRQEFSKMLDEPARLFHPRSMLIHVVLFSLKESCTSADKEKLIAGLESLKSIETLRGIYIGSPAATPERPVIIKDYDVMLTTIFDDLEGHNTYAVHPTHLKFIDDHKALWSSVRVLDAD